MAADPWTELTWDDLTTWAGPTSVQRGKTYHNTGRVSRLARTADGGLLANVRGTTGYVTHVTLTKGRLDSECSCPVGKNCKHAVAVILSYTAAVDAKTVIPTAGENDPRWAMFDGTGGYDEDDDYEGEEGEEDEYEAEAVARAGARGGVARAADAKRPRVKAKAGKPPTVEEYLAALSEVEVRELLLEFARSVPAVRKELAERAALSTGDVGALVKEARAEIRKRTKEQAWRHHWDGESSLPDYGPLRRLFGKLLEMQAFDELVSLGRELFERGTEQIGRSDDEGDTQCAIRDCLTVAWQGLVRSSRPFVEKWLLLEELALGEEYDLIEFPEELHDADFTPADWSAIADRLLAGVPAVAPGKDRYSERYRRDRRVSAVIGALDAAGRADEATALCEREAPLTESYVRLVDRLLAAGRVADAERWIVVGATNTKATSPGIAKQLADKRRDIAAKKKDHPTVAAFAAEDFFAWPSAEKLDALLKAAKAAKCEPAVRAGAMRFLETAERPKPPAKKGAKAADAWPLPDAPVPAEPRPRYGQPAPHYSVLIDLALRDKDPAGALKWYDRWAGTKPDGFHNGYSERIADAVRDSHPERALAIYRAVAGSLIEGSRYDEAKPRLKQVRDLFAALGRPADWTVYESELRTKYARRRNLMPVLDALAGKSKKLTDK